MDPVDSMSNKSNASLISITSSYEIPGLSKLLELKAVAFVTLTADVFFMI